MTVLDKLSRRTYCWSIQPTKLYWSLQSQMCIQKRQEKLQATSTDSISSNRNKDVAVTLITKLSTG